MKFHSGCKNFDNQPRSGNPQTEDSEAVLQAIETNPVSSIWRVSGVVGIPQLTVVHHLHDRGKSFWSSRIEPYVTKILQNF